MSVVVVVPPGIPLVVAVCLVSVGAGAFRLRFGYGDSALYFLATSRVLRISMAQLARTIVPEIPTHANRMHCHPKGRHFSQSGKRKVVVIVRERDGKSVLAVFRTEGQAQSWIKKRLLKGTVLHTDEAASWDGLHGAFEVKRINHQEAYSLDGACTNYAEEYFSRTRRGEIGIIIISPESTCSARRRKARGGRIIGARATVTRPSTSRGWRCTSARRRNLSDIDSGT